MLSGRSYGGRPARSWPSSRMRAGGRRLEAGQHPQQRRLAAARGAEQREDLALGDVDADVVDGAVAVEVLDDVLDLEERRGLHRVEAGAKPALSMASCSRAGGSASPREASSAAHTRPPVRRVRRSSSLRRSS